MKQWYNVNQPVLFLDCLFCLTNICGFSKKTLSYLICRLWAKSHSIWGEDSCCTFHSTWIMEDHYTSDDEFPGCLLGKEYLAHSTGEESHLKNKQLSNIVRYMSLLKKEWEVLITRLKQWSVLHTVISIFCSQHEDFNHFWIKNTVCFYFYL